MAAWMTPALRTPPGVAATSRVPLPVPAAARGSNLKSTTSLAGVQAVRQGRNGRQRQQAAAGRTRRLHCAAIGFELPGAESDNKSAEKHAEELTRNAASLLLYSGVLRGKPAQAFLGVLQLLQKGNPLSLVQQYGEMYRLLAADDHASWQDYLLDQVIKGSDSPLARAAAAGKPTAHLRAAAAHDLDILQQLAVLERTLAGWVKATAYGVTDQWLEAASSLAPPAHAAGRGGGSGGWVEPESVREALLAAAEPPPALLAPLSEAQRAGLRAELAGKWRWSEGTELLERYHAAHGYGLVSQHSVLTWTGKLQAQDVLKGAHELAAAEQEGLVEVNHHASLSLLRALTDFLRQDLDPGSGSGASRRSPPHVAVCGNATDRWLFTAWALQRLEQHVPAELRPQAAGLRTLVLPSSQLGNLADLAWSLSQHPRARFAVVANGLGSSSGSMASGDLAAMLSGVDGFSWPPNALLLAGFPEAPPEELAPVFKHTATIEDRFAA